MDMDKMAMAIQDTDTLKSQLADLVDSTFNWSTGTTPEEFGAVGDGVSDDTAALQAMFDAKPRSMRMSGTYSITAGLNLFNHSKFSIFGGGSIVCADSMPITTQFYGIQFRTCSNFVVSDVSIDGNRAGRGIAETVIHLVMIQESTDGMFYNVDASNGPADGFYIGTRTPDDSTTFSNRILFLKCRGYSNARQGMSIINAWNTVVDQCDFSDTYGFNPQAGIDIEPNVKVPADGFPSIRNVTIRDCNLENNVQGVMVISAYMEGVTIANNVIKNNIIGVFGGSKITLQNNQIIDHLATKWSATTAYAIGDKVYTPTTEKVYVCTIAGTSGTVEPSTETTPTFDGSATWEWRGTTGITPRSIIEFPASPEGEDSLVIGNTIDGVSDDLICLYASGTNPGITFDGNTVGNAYKVGQVAGSKNVFSNNRIKNITQTSADAFSFSGKIFTGNTFDCDGKCVNFLNDANDKTISNNSFESQAGEAVIRFVGGDGNTTFSGNIVNKSGTTTDSVRVDNGVIVKTSDNVFGGVPSFNLGTGSSMGFDPTAPTAGDWNLGDRVYNSTPSVGGSVGWVCVVAGTPGTWKTFGTIEA